jgi:hypothetical protein
MVPANQPDLVHRRVERPAKAGRLASRTVVTEQAEGPRSGRLRLLIPVTVPALPAQFVDEADVAYRPDPVTTWRTAA